MTTPAKTIITNPTFLKTFEEAAPPAQKSGLLRTLMGSRALPMIGRVLPVVGTAFVAYEVCNWVFSGCLSFEDDGEAEAPALGKWKWVNRKFTFWGAEIGPMTYYWEASPLPWKGVNVPSGCTTASVAPAGATSYSKGEPSIIWCGSEIGEIPYDKAVPLRVAPGHHVNYGGGTGSAYGGSDYCNAWGGSDSCVSEPPKDWSKAAAAALQNEMPPEVGQWIASKVEGSEIADPYAVFVNIPDCDGLLWPACEDLLEELDLEPVRQAEDWKGAVVTQPAEAVLDLQPASGVKVEAPSKVTVITNPDEGGMPLFIPTINPGESYEDFIARLAPQWKPTETVLSPEFTDPAYGPNDVTRTTPDPGTRADPASEPGVDVFTNPADAPPAAGSWTAPAIPAIELSPLAGVGIGCNDFPFGVFCWIGDGLTSWGGGSGVCPEVDVPLGSSVKADTELPFDFCQFEPAMEIIRPVIVVVAAFCLAYFFAAAAMGLGGGSNED